MSENCFAAEQPLILSSRAAEREDDCACADSLVLGDPADSENDCACAEAISPQSPPTETTYQCAPVYTTRLNEDFRLALGRHGPCVLNKAAWQQWNDFGAARPLATPFERRLAEEGLLTPQTPAPLDPRPHVLTAWLHITNRCNLACPYCYVEKSAASMSRETAEKAVDALIERAVQERFHTLKLKYAGGEATLEFERIRQTHAYAKGAAAKAHISLTATLLTNGTRLTPFHADWLAGEGLKLMVSVDGTGPAHDALRQLRGGAGTFERIEQVIDQILIPRKITPFISMTLTGQNAASAPALARWCIQRGLPLSFNFYRHSSRVADDALDFDHQAILSGMEAAYRVYEEQLPSAPFLNGLLDRFQVGAHPKTCGAGSSYVAIDHEGRLTACHMLMGTSGQPALHNLPVEEKADCRDCLFGPYCTGGCPLETFQATGQWDQPSPHCELYRRLIPQALRLEGLRLLKSNGYLQ